MRKQAVFPKNGEVFQEWLGKYMGEICCCFWILGRYHKLQLQSYTYHLLIIFWDLDRLGGGFKYALFSQLPKEMIWFDDCADSSNGLVQPPTNHGWSTYPLQHTPLRNKALIRPYEGKPMVNKDLIRPDFWVGYVRGIGWLAIKLCSRLRIWKPRRWQIYDDVWVLWHGGRRPGRPRRIFPPKGVLIFVWEIQVRELFSNSPLPVNPFFCKLV